MKRKPKHFREAFDAAVRAVRIPREGRKEPMWADDNYRDALERRGCGNEDERATGFILGWLARDDQARRDGVEREPRCEGCDKPATTQDSDGVPLCAKCMRSLVADLKDEPAGSEAKGTQS